MGYYRNSGLKSGTVTFKSCPLILSIVKNNGKSACKFIQRTNHHVSSKNRYKYESPTYEDVISLLESPGMVSAIVVFNGRKRSFDFIPRKDGLKIGISNKFHHIHRSYDDEDDINYGSFDDDEEGQNYDEFDEDERDYDAFDEDDEYYYDDEYYDEDDEYYEDDDEIKHYPTLQRRRK